MNGKLSFLLVITEFFCFRLRRLRFTWEQGTHVTWSLWALWLDFRAISFLLLNQNLWAWTWSGNGLSVSGVLSEPASLSVWGPQGAASLVLVTHMLRSWLLVWLKLEESRGTNPSQFAKDFLTFSHESPGKTRMVGLPRRVRIISALFPAGFGWKRLRGSWSGLT